MLVYEEVVQVIVVAQIENKLGKVKSELGHRSFLFMLPMPAGPTGS